MSADLTVTYWGVTGSMSDPLRPEQVTNKVLACLEYLIEQGRLAALRPGPELREALRRELEAVPFAFRSTWGGNTTCVEVATPDGLFILDCGSGMRELGVELYRRWNDPAFPGPREAQVLVTHPHMDHTFATPFFGPYYDPRNRFTIWGTQSVLDSLRAVLSDSSVLAQTYFPLTFAQMKALQGFVEVRPGKVATVGETRVLTYALRHPGGCVAYRLESGGKSFVFATDHEHAEAPDPGLAEFARGADLFYTEGQYTQEEYEGQRGLPGEPPLPRRGWGHSPVEACIKTAVAAGVKILHVGHRDPLRSDDDLARMEVYCRELLAQELQQTGRPPGSTKVAIPYEGLRMQL